MPDYHFSYCLSNILFHLVTVNENFLIETKRNETKRNETKRRKNNIKDNKYSWAQAKVAHTPPPTPTPGISSNCLLAWPTQRRTDRLYCCLLLLVTWKPVAVTNDARSCTLLVCCAPQPAFMTTTYFRLSMAAIFALWGI